MYVENVYICMKMKEIFFRVAEKIDKNKNKKEKQEKRREVPGCE